jgi:transcriptional regulator with GAF, ATPase, and Fis domain
MREALEADRAALLSRLQRQDISDVVIGESGGLRRVMERVELVASTDAPVLLLGETGSGKEVIARAIHARSKRAKGPIVRVNCGAIPSELVDSELFGHERGSFTGAVGTRKGWFERADGGTLFLDEIGELPLAAQVRLLRVLQDGTLERVGGHQTISVDVRIVAATNRHLESMVSKGAFREDLWYRLSVFPIRLPALRERLEDLPALAAHFAESAGKRLGGAGLAPTSADIELLRSYAWPGNVRELAAVIERAAILGDGKRLELAAALGATSLAPASLPPVGRTVEPLTTGSDDAQSIATLDEAMAAHIRRALAVCHGRIEGPFGAAKLLGINPHTLRARMRKLGVEWSRFRNQTLGLSAQER